MDKYKIIVTFTEPLLGTVSLDPEIYKMLINKDEVSEDMLEQELETIPEPDPETDTKGITGFHEFPDGTPLLYDYVIKGFMKDACGMLRRVPGTESKKIRAYRKIISGLVFALPRQIPLVLPEGEVPGELSRPLRASTAQGERVALATSYTCPPGTSMTFEVVVLGQITHKLMKEWFDYGIWYGFGQWRNAGYGRFQYELEEIE